ncbi:MAG: HemN C-terminal region [Saliniramus fredricksonii]|uniref:1-acyl-sn-glycerol-3-phosphate acyltransferase n=1 Tax=Saliniramus fredricksonii TaxID=1653334 RepID=A0A0P7X319_9HYPH|nr:lysophospholipid acyltransferase family protein [Saliniramus fredricksonii]KPQ09063.1 MAG: HemN C-terminal region [Saliniramus fredricksonii]SCC78327.1 1-acyl-sn-glycerol-3-phosphate acyltransferase [Saliniramus fredricksonii]
MAADEPTRARLDRLAARLPEATRPTRRRKPRVVSFFTRHFDRYFRRHMNALRLAQWGAPPDLRDDAPVVLYTNHPAWWDAAIYVLLSEQHFGRRASYAPIDAEMLEKYGFFGRMGAYGVDLESRRGAQDFLAASADILAHDDAVIWVTAQGRFMDVRVRPLDLKPGIAHLVEIAPHAQYVPVALEYGFWEQRGGEAFVAYGEALCGADLAGMEREARLAYLQDALTRIADRLSEDVISRDPARFDVLIEGKAGVGGVFDFTKRILARLKGERYDPAHGRRDK